MLSSLFSIEFQLGYKQDIYFLKLLVEMLKLEYCAEVEKVTDPYAACSSAGFPRKTKNEMFLSMYISN